MARSATAATTAQLEFTQAMSDFRVMFPEMDADVIEAVLRANNGSVDATIDNLLSMQADNETEKAMHEEEGKTFAGPPSYQQATQEPEGDLINLGGSSDAEDKEEENKSALKSNPPVSSDTFDLLSELENIGASGGAASSTKPPSSTPAAGSTSQSQAAPQHSYTHPKRQDAEAEPSFPASPPQPPPTGSRPAAPSIVPTNRLSTPISPAATPACMASGALE